MTCDKNLLQQQNTTGLEISVIVLPTQDIVKLSAIAESIAAAFVEVRPNLPILIDQDGGIRRFSAGKAQKN